MRRQQRAGEPRERSAAVPKGGRQDQVVNRVASSEALKVNTLTRNTLTRNTRSSCQPLPAIHHSDATLCLETCAWMTRYSDARCRFE